MAFPVTETNPEDIPLNEITTNGFVRGETWKDQTDIDRELYGSRFAYLTCESRSEDPNSNITYYESTDNSWHVPVFGLMFTVPQALPGSENQTSAGTGATAATRGGLAVRANAENCIVEFAIRKIVLNGDGRLADGGPYATTQLSFTSRAWDPDPASTNLLYPTGFAPGDLYQLNIAFIATDADPVTNPARLYGWDVREPILQNASP